MGKSAYIIQFGGLPVGLHDYTFEVNDTFFKSIENSEISVASIGVEARLTKQNNVLQIHFNINGTVEMDCDKCLKGFDFPLQAQENLVIKHGNPSESTDEILVIPEGQEEVDVAHYLYEYITLALPARRVPCEINSKKYTCDKETLDKLHTLEPGESKEINNPLWEQLNKIKFNKS